MENDNKNSDSSFIKYIPFALGFMGMEYFLITSFPGWKGLGYALAFGGTILSLIVLVLTYNKIKASAVKKIAKDLRVKKLKDDKAKSQQVISKIKSHSQQFKDIAEGKTS
ncbi:hypothetical protein ALQ37_200090 [Pseudomonas syringae pv. aptata]|uniref:Uncharacterized protein n=1 Tax=Pseudomonas syringae pv. aptata TaxID=83167 RepID=A0A3M3X5R7_PSEAP|nr:hypothetical protein [Pseudomonas syringae]RMO65380.1 hypothetical protein ALQ37_200090 [Pseudomonas syringae pv. aptata]